MLPCETTAIQCNVIRLSPKNIGMHSSRGLGGRRACTKIMTRVVLCPDYLQKIWSVNKTKQCIVPAGACPQARSDTPGPFGGAYTPLPPPPPSPPPPPPPPPPIIPPLPKSKYRVYVQSKRANFEDVPVIFKKVNEEYLL